VQRVRRLVGIDADEAALHAQRVAPERRSAEDVGADAQLLRGDPREVAEQLVRAGGLHLHEERLALVHPHADREAHRLARPGAGQPHLVERMPGLVHHAHDAGEKIALVVARGHAHVLGGAAAERMRAHVEPAAREVEAHALREMTAERGLLRDRERTAEIRRARPTPLHLEDAIDERRQLTLEPREQRREDGLARAALVLVGQCIIHG